MSSGTRPTRCGLFNRHAVGKYGEPVFVKARYLKIVLKMRRDFNLSHQVCSGCYDTLKRGILRKHLKKKYVASLNSASGSQNTQSIISERQNTQSNQSSEISNVSDMSIAANDESSSSHSGIIPLPQSGTSGTLTSSHQTSGTTATRKTRQTSSTPTTRTTRQSSGTPAARHASPVVPEDDSSRDESSATEATTVVPQNTSKSASTAPSSPRRSTAGSRAAQVADDVSSAASHRYQIETRLSTLQITADGALDGPSTSAAAAARRVAAAAAGKPNMPRAQQPVRFHLQDPQATPRKRTREEKIQDAIADRGLRVTDGTRLPHIQPAPRRRQFVTANKQIMDLYLQDLTGG